MSEELKELAEIFGWDIYVWHDEYRGVLCDVQRTNEGLIPLYRFPSGVCMY